MEPTPPTRSPTDAPLPTGETDPEMAARQRGFIRAYGHRARLGDLAAVFKLEESAVAELRKSIHSLRLERRLEFSALFALWHGRAPADDDWPRPRRSARGHYPWQERELNEAALLRETCSGAEVARILSDRLRKASGDPQARRTCSTVWHALRDRQRQLQESAAPDGAAAPAQAASVPAPAPGSLDDAAR